MAPRTMKRALGAVKDQTSIGIAKVAKSTSLSDLDVAILKATKHGEYPAEEKYIKEILSLTCYSRAFISACVSTLAKRLSKTKNWIVALKTLILIQRLLSEGDPAYEQEIFFATKRGTRLLNLSDFQDRSVTRSWDYSSFVRTYALYLDERLEYRMQNRHGKCSAFCFEEEDYQEKDKESYSKATPVREMKTERVIQRAKHLQIVLERFLACRPAGKITIERSAGYVAIMKLCEAKNHRLVMVALCPIVKESFQIYEEMTDTMAILVESFNELDVNACVKIYEMSSRLANQFDELDMFLSWCKKIGIRSSSEYPEIDKITEKQREIMDSYIKEKLESRRDQEFREEVKNEAEEQKEEEPKEEDMNSIKALPGPEGSTNQEPNEKEEDLEEEPREEPRAEKVAEEFGDLLNLHDDAPSTEEHADNMALVLFDGAAATANGPDHPVTPVWEAFKDTEDWETALVQSTSYLHHQKISLGGGLDTMLLDGLYQQSARAAAMAGPGFGTTGSDSSVAWGASERPAMLALPAPPTPGTSGSCSINPDPFTASIPIAPPAYVQMSEMQMKQKLLVEEQLMWQQYARDGMQRHVTLSSSQHHHP